MSAYHGAEQRSIITRIINARKKQGMLHSPSEKKKKILGRKYFFLYVHMCTLVSRGLIPLFMTYIWS